MGISCLRSVVGDIDEERRSGLLGEGVRVGLKYGVASQWTNFVAGRASLLFSVSRQQLSSTLKPLFALILHPVSEQQQQQQQLANYPALLRALIQVLCLKLLPRCWRTRGAWW